DVGKHMLRAMTERRPLYLITKKTRKSRIPYFVYFRVLRDLRTFVVRPACVLLHNQVVRFLVLALVLAAVVVAAQESPRAAPQSQSAPAVNDPPPFDLWLENLMTEAHDRGYSANLVEQTLAGLKPLPRVIQNDRAQAELVVGFERYYRARVNARFVQQGRELARRHRDLLARVENTYDVQRRFVLSIWGIETRYGRVTGNTPVFQALATLAWEPRRADFFRGELFDALTMVSRGHIDVASMTGSWAGAMGHPQFMPSSYLKYAEDFDRDGRTDIWRSTGDALASIANYLEKSGWDDDYTWGREVRVTPAVRERIEKETTRRTEGCYAMRNMTERIPLTEWQQLGVRRVNGAALPAVDIKAGLVTTDTRSFLVYENYDAILRYNCAHYYALTVALLADQIR
ncbi:MAG TPA: lytic murein transglycosylase, partial [Blastocatellia bacterium]|nr:lytic murein transglycosylase [Blastocatellia bacterium]